MGTLKRRFVIPAIVLVVTFALFQFVLFVGYVPTESMEPTLHKGSFIVGTRIFGEMEVGDIVVFQHEGKLVVKRIAGIGGDTVIHDEERLIIPDGAYYLLGDNTEMSFDSRYWSCPFISKEKVVARFISVLCSL